MNKTRLFEDEIAVKVYRGADLLRDFFYPSQPEPSYCGILVTMCALIKRFLFLGLTIPFSACTAQTSSGSFNAMLNTLLSHSVPEISVNQAVELHTSGALFLDARELREYEVSHIQGATYVGYDHFDPQRVAGVAVDRPIVVYCSVGYRSEKIAERLRAAGYTQVSNLYGGIFEWVNQGLPVVSGPDEVTKRVHAYNRTWGVWLKKGEKVYR